MPPTNTELVLELIQEKTAQTHTKRPLAQNKINSHQKLYLDLHVIYEVQLTTYDISNAVPNHTDTILDTSFSASSLDQSDIQRMTDTSETIIVQLHQLTHRITVDTSISNTSATIRRDTNANVCTPEKSQPCHSHFTVPLIPIAESTPLKSLTPGDSTVDTYTSPIIKQDLTFSHSLSLPEHTPLSKAEEKFNTHLFITIHRTTQSIVKLEVNH